MQVIVKNYCHYNRTLGIQINSKAHYERVCQERGMVSFEEAQELAEKGREARTKNYKVSDESLAIIQQAKGTKDSKGNIKLSDRAIDKLIEKKAIGRKIPSYMELPAHYDKGGFSK
jgi:hypothetical protein